MGVNQTLGDEKHGKSLEETTGSMGAFNRCTRHFEQELWKHGKPYSSSIAPPKKLHFI